MSKPAYLVGNLMVLSLSLIFLSPAAAYPVVKQDKATAEVTEFAAALIRAASTEEQERLLAQKPHLVGSPLLTTLLEQVGTQSKKNDWALALKTSELAIRLAERTGNRPALGRALAKVGGIHSSMNRAPQALESLLKSLPLCEETGDRKELAIVLHNIGYAYRLQSRYEQALEYLHKSQVIFREIGEAGLTAMALNNIGVVHRLQSRYELALEFYQQSRAISEKLGEKVPLKNTLNSMGGIYSAQGNYPLALELYQQALVICEEIKDRAGEIVAASNLGSIYSSQGRYYEALACFQKCLKLSEQMGSSANKSNLAYTLNNLGLLYLRQGREAQALEFYRQSLKLREELNDKFGLRTSLTNLGAIYHAQGLEEPALEWFQKSLTLAEEINDRAGIAHNLSNIGDLYRQQQRFDLALTAIQKSLRINEEINNRLGIAQALEKLAFLYEAQGNYAEMLLVCRRATQLAEELNAPEVLWQMQECTGRALRALGQSAEARQNFLAAISTIEALRHQVAGGEQQQQSFLENRLTPWLELVNLYLTQKEDAAAFTVAEQSKARVLRDVLQAGRLNLQKSLSLSERQAEQAQRQRLITLNLALTREQQSKQPDAQRLSELKTEVTKAQLAHEALEAALYVAHPELRVQRGESPVIQAEELAALMPDAANALLEYVVADDEVYLFAITKDAGLKAYTLPVKGTELARRIDTFRQQLAARDLGFRATATKLSDLLLKPAQAQLKGKTRLVIVPDGQLWELPFQALLTGAKRYLIEDATLSYAPSLTVLREMMKRQSSQSAAPTLLALGNPALGKETVERATFALRDGKFEPLPEAESEVKALGQLYGAANSKVFTGAAAREDRAKAEAGQMRVLHFATHGVLNNAAPLYSHLVLTQSEQEDGLLEAWELMQMDLHADLAVLSACETARGQFGAGEGVIGWSWALFVAGVPTTVVSQWKVESAATRELMVNFHRQLRIAQTTKAAALRQAALAVLKQPATSHPFYWAGFVLVGDGR
jgi:CHAT domain-containing protein